MLYEVDRRRNSSELGCNTAGSHSFQVGALVAEVVGRPGSTMASSAKPPKVFFSVGEELPNCAGIGLAHAAGEEGVAIEQQGAGVPSSQVVSRCRRGSGGMAGHVQARVTRCRRG